MTLYSIVVDGDPVAWQRAGYNSYTGAKFTQAKTRKREEEIAAAWRYDTDNYMFPEGSQLCMKILFYFPIPKGAAKYKKEAMERGVIRPIKRPDGDNLYKLVADALNGVAYKDDSSIVFGEFRKYYSEYPRTEITIFDVCV